jgi:ABC-type bacteriocin/lantibiotic exporter with double-glycine peptidase domain
VPKQLLPIPHQQQQSDGDCLAACAAMVLAYFGRSVEYGRLLQLLRIKAYGAPASNIRLLTQLDLTVTYGVTDIPGLENMLAQGYPIIVFVRTGDLPHWTYATDHALVVAGCDEVNLYVNDPNFAEAPLIIPRDDFELAWLERDYYYALVTL